MTVRIKPIKSTGRVIVGMTRNIHRHQSAIQAALHVIGDIVGRRNKRLIRQGPKTGRIYTFRGRRHQASAPGEAPANRSGRLMKSYNYNVHGPFQMEVGQSAPYAGFLEDGTGRIRPRPNMIRAINETQGDAVRAFYDETDKVVIEQ